MRRNTLQKALHEAWQHLHDAQNEEGVPMKQDTLCDCVIKTNFKKDAISIEKLQHFLSTLWAAWFYAPH